MKAFRLAIVMLTSIGAAASAQTPSASQLDSIITKAVTEKHIVGLSVGVMQNGQVLLAKSYGTRDIASKSPVTPKTMFAIGSVTKQFTCSAIMMLAEEHKVSLSDPVSKYFPNLTRAKDITLLDLGGHLSGYHDYYPLDFVDREMQKPATPDQIIAEYATKTLDFEPRSHYSYSNTGFLILGRVVEKTSGESFGAFLSKRIFTPLHLQRTQYEPGSPTPAADMATGYTSFGLSEPLGAEPEGKGWAGPAGAIWSTPSDLMTWDLALLEKRLISPSSYAAMTTAQRLSDGRASGYGCGESVNDRGPALVLSHGGAVSGFVAQNTVIPATKSAVVVLSNTDFSPIGELNAELVRRMLPPNPDVPQVTGMAPLEAAQKFLAGLERGAVDRASLGDDFNQFLSADKIAAGRKALNALGTITNVKLENRRERGGMEVATVSFKVGSTNAVGLMYRTPDGRIQEFLISRN